MSFLRKTFPGESVTPKLHMLENHVVDFISKWKIGLGLYGEQGGESIHPEFNMLRSTYSSVRPPASRVRVIMEQHHLKVTPICKSYIPEIKKRKKELQIEE